MRKIVLYMSQCDELSGKENEISEIIEVSDETSDEDLDDILSDWVIDRSSQFWEEKE